MSEELIVTDDFTWLVSALRMMARAKDVIRDTHGNLSKRYPGTDHHNEWFLIKPSGMDYDLIGPADICGMSFDGQQWAGEGRKPSVDSPHHAAIYKKHEDIGAICHTHSPYATAFAIAGEDIECVSTEQADYFGHHIRCLPYADLDSWGKMVALDRSPFEKALLLENHGVLTFGKDPEEAVRLAIALENIAMKVAISRTLLIRREYPMEPEEMEKWHKRYQNVYGQ